MVCLQICNHPALTYPPETVYEPEVLVQQCGKFAVLDRILVKQKASGHRVLLFSTMTRLLDLLEIYLRWRYVDTLAGPATMGFLRIDGGTSLEDRYGSINLVAGVLNSLTVIWAAFVYAKWKVIPSST